MVFIWLDDVRPAPDGWVRCWTATEAINALIKGDVAIISLDHDLGDGGYMQDHPGTGYDVLCWMEEKKFNDPSWVVPIIKIHSANPVGVARMKVVADKLNK